MGYIYIHCIYRIVIKDIIGNINRILKKKRNDFTE